MRAGLFALALGGLVLHAAPARAVNCAITDVTGVAFGAYSPFAGTDVVSMGSVTYVCSLFGIFDKVTINLSKGSSGSYFPRTLLTGSHPLQYNLYLDAARTQVWGDNTGGTFQYGPTVLNLLPITVPIYGKIPGGQNAWQGAYQDSVTVTMLF
jgi:spore coat protein U-like protein